MPSQNPNMNLNAPFKLDMGIFATSLMLYIDRACIVATNSSYHLMHFHWSRAHYVLCEWLLANNSLLIRIWWQITSLSCQTDLNMKQTWWSNEKKQLLNSVIAKYHDLSDQLLVSLFGYWQITIFCSTLSNNC